MPAVYEETCVLLLTADEVKSEEALSLMLWDSDEHTSDDLIGRVKVDVKELMKEPNVTHRRADPLMGFEDADKMQGKLHWSVGYYEKAALNPKLEIPEEHPAVQPSKTLPEMEMRPGDAAPNPAAKDGPPPLPSPERTPFVFVRSSRSSHAQLTSGSRNQTRHPLEVWHPQCRHPSDQQS